MTQMFLLQPNKTKEQNWYCFLILKHIMK